MSLRLWTEDLLSKVIRVGSTGGEMYDREALRLKAGAGVTLTATDSAVNGETVVEISATGGSGNTTAAVPTWEFDSGTASTDPGTGKLRFNNATIASATQVNLSYAGLAGTNLTFAMKALRAGDLLQLQQGAAWATCRLTGTPDEVESVLLPVSVVSSGGTFEAGEPVHVTPFPAARRSEPTWTFDSTTTDADPGAGKFRLNVASPMTDSTFIYVADSEAFTVDWATAFATLAENSFVLIQQASGDARFLCRVTGLAQDASGYTKIPIEVISTRGGVNFTAGSLCSFSFLDGQGLRPTDGAFITRQSANTYKANINRSTTHNAATAKELASLYMEANTVASIGVVIHATEVGSPTVRASLRFELDIQCEADNDMVKVDALCSHQTPYALPLSSVPDWIGAGHSAFNSLVTVDVTTDNYVTIKVTPANTDTVRWTIDVEAVVTEL
jgi:hypothetical protein